MQPLYQTTAPSSARGLMALLWGNALAAYVSNDPKFGVRVQNDFTQFSPLGLTGTTSATHEGGWTAQDSVTAGGTYAVTDAVQAGGQVLIASGSTTADEGVEFAASVNSICLPTHATTPSRRLVAQFRIDAVAVNGQQLALLTDAACTTPVAGANDAIADVGYIGFQVDEDGDLNFVSKSAAAGTSDSVEVIENADFVQLDPHVIGFSIDASGVLEIVVDNVRYKSKALQISSASYPTGILAPRLACTTSGTTAPSMRVDSVDVFAEQAG